MLTTYEYDNTPGGTWGRVLRSFTASPWTEEDRALMMAHAQYVASLCKGCGHPKEKAWHPHNDGWYEVTETFECNACTALARESNPAAETVEFHAVTYTRDEANNPLPPMPSGPRLTAEQLEEAMGGAD